MATNRRKPMEINTMTLDELLLNLTKIFNVEQNRMQIKKYDNFFDIILTYLNYDIHIYTNMEKNHKKYQEIEIKKNSIEYKYEWTSFGLLLAYYDKKQFNMNINYAYLLKCISKLKEYIEANHLFFEYYSNDFSKRFFVLDDKIKEMPICIDLTNEDILRFGENAYKIQNYLPKL